MDIVSGYRSGSGRSISDCCFIGIRYDQDFGLPRPEEAECWAGWMRADPKDPKRSQWFFQKPSMRWYSGLWRSPAGKVYVVDMSRFVQTNDDVFAPDAPQRWQEEKLGTPLLGVWGIDDRCVFAWGTNFEQQHFVYRWDGTRWRELPSPGFEVRAMHGIAPDLVYAVGSDGSIAWWDGGQWTEVESGVSEHLLSVFVVSRDEIYATGSAGSLLEGSAHGWGVIAQGPLQQVGGAPLLAVAKWKGELWIGGGGQGLFKRVGITGNLDNVKPKVYAIAFDARWDLLITCFEKMTSTSDGKDFYWNGENALRDVRDGYDIRDIG